MSVIYFFSKVYFGYVTGFLSCQLTMITLCFVEYQFIICLGMIVAQLTSGYNGSKINFTIIKKIV
jgi:hypothetical protein